MSTETLRLEIRDGRTWWMAGTVRLPLDAYPYVVIPDPDDDRSYPVYAGPAGYAGRLLRDGEYEAFTERRR